MRALAPSAASTGGPQLSALKGCQHSLPWRLLSALNVADIITVVAAGPFFIAMGHHRPHLSWISPARYIDQYGKLPMYIRLKLW